MREALLAQRPVGPPPVVFSPVDHIPAVTPPVATPQDTATVVPPARASHVDEIVLDIDEQDAQLPDLVANLRDALRANPGKRLRVKWWLE